MLLFATCFQERFSLSLNEIDCEKSCTQPSIVDFKLEAVPVVTGLTAPSNMAFLNHNDILILERYSGEIRRIINDTLQPMPFFDVNVAAGAGERGLLGIAVSRESSHTYVFLYFTESKSDGGYPIGNRLYRYELVNDHLSNPKLLLDLPYSPGPYHNGGGMVIGPDRNVYLTIGDLDNVDDKIRPNTTIQNKQDGGDPNGSGGMHS
jgi:glucose/arabinose dehydrogenase